MKLTQSGPSASTGTLSLFYSGDEAHAGFDNVTFLSRNTITFVEDAGDTLHAQRNALDSGWVWNVDSDYSQPGQPAGPLARRGPRRLGDARRRQRRLRHQRGRQRDHRRPSSPTATPASTGSSAPSPRTSAATKWRWFYTQQHGDNRTYEVTLKSSHGHDD